MSDRQSDHHELFEQIHQFVTARINEEMSPEQFARLDGLLGENAAARRLYVQYIYETLALPSLVGALDSDDMPPLPLEEGAGDWATLQADGPDAAVDSPRSFDLETQIPIPRFPLVTPHSLQTSPPFVGSPVFSYMAAVLILGVMLLFAWAYKPAAYLQLTHDRSQWGTSGEKRDDMVFVGRITGMKDCRWAEPDTIAYPGSSVPLGRKYALSAGLMEITYDSGAKVILEGPCTYQVETRASGFLSLGKLTAQVKKSEEGRGKGEIGGLAASAASGRTQAANPEPRTPNPEPLFAVRTPTAVVTDLGTEFGVEVDAKGDTTSYRLPRQGESASGRRTANPKTLYCGPMNRRGWKRTKKPARR